MKEASFSLRLAAGCRRWLPLTRRARQELAPGLGRVQAARKELDRAMREIEGHFLAIGTRLENTTNLGRDLVGKGEALLALALGQGGGEIMIEEAAQHIWQAIEFAEENDRSSAQLIERLLVSNEAIRRALVAEQTLARTLAPLTYVQTLFRIEAARLPREVQEMFHALVREIERIRHRVEGGFREKFQLVREVQTILDHTISHLVGRQQQQQKNVTVLRQQLTESLAAMKQSYEKNRDRDTRLTAMSQAVSTETGRVVMSLQFQDIITQKLQHVLKTLDEMQAEFTALPRDRAAACRSLRFIQQAGQIADGQLGAITGELQQAGATVGGGLQQITGQMDQLDSDSLTLRDLDTVTTGVDGAVQILLDSLADVHRLVGDAGRHAQDAHGTIAPIGKLTSNFTAFMRELALEIHLIGLNAEVQAAHVGRGTGLEILSAHTSAVARGTSGLSTALALDLDVLVSGLGQVVDAFGQIREDTAKYQAAMDAVVARDTSFLHAYRDNSLVVLQEISALLPALRQETRAAAEHIDFSAVATTQLTALQAAVNELVATARALADESGVQIDTKGLTDRFMTGYTMSSEVEVHQRALGEPVGTGGLAVAAAPTGEIELFGFDDPAPAAVAPGMSPVAATAAPPPEIDLWLDAPPEATKPAGGPMDGEQRAAA